MPQALDRSHYLIGDTRFSALSKPLEDWEHTRERVPVNIAELRRMTTLGGKASGGFTVPVYDPDAVATTGTGLAELLDRFVDQVAVPFTQFPVATADTFARVYQVRALTESPTYDEGLGVHSVQFVLEQGRMGSGGLVFHDNFGGVGETGIFDGTSITFVGGVASGDAMELNFHAWNVTGGPGDFDGLFESAPLSDYVGATTRFTLATVSSGSLPGNGQTSIIEGPITDPEWRLRGTGITAGTFFVAASGRILRG